jgi:ribosomal RNA-processing protein 8
MSKTRLSRRCQLESHESIVAILSNQPKCLVKMFCGSGKSRIIVETVISLNNSTSVLVFPSLALIYQFYYDYLSKKVCPDELVNHTLLNVSSEIIPNIESTTEPDKILQFFGTLAPKIICVTYQSLNTLLDNTGDTVIDICLFDEAHRSTSSEYKKLIYDEPYKSKCHKQVFFTATPVNKNNIVMFDRDSNVEGSYGDCGELAYEYTYLQGVHDDILKLFDIRIDMYTENTTDSIYETISRAILTTGNNRVLTFHADVSEDSKSDTSVKRFVDDKLFRVAFNKIIQTEFPDKKGMYKKITLRGLTGKDKDKNDVLTRFENTKDNEIFILASCATIGEGVDTKTANMCVFVDPKTSYTNIIQNIGRIVRKTVGLQTATVLIPIYVDTNKYADCGDDTEKRDRVIREELVNGNYNGISNVCAALKEEDAELYDIMVRYPSNFTQTERENAIKSQNCRIDEEDVKQEYEVEEMIEEGEPVEIHTSNTDEPIIRHNMEDCCDDVNITHLFQTEEEDDDGDMNVVYYPIISGNGKKVSSELKPPQKRQRPRLDFHCNDEIQMLWGIKDDCEIGNGVCSRVIECQVERMDSVELWKINLDKLVKYMELNNKCPSSKDKNPEIKTLANWVTNQKTNYDPDINKCKYIMKNQEIHTLWTKTLVKYRGYLGNLAELWKLNLNKLVKYMDVNKKCPSTIDKTPEIKKLGGWVGHQKGNYDPDINKCNQIMKTQEIHLLWSEILETYKEYLAIGTNELWKLDLNKLVNYMDVNKKSPSNSDENIYIKKLATWVGTQKKTYDPNINKCKHIMKTQEIHSLWSETLVKYSDYLVIDKVELWKLNQNKLVDYMDVNKKCPSKWDKNTDIKQLGSWVCHQKANYDHDINNCKEGMKTQEIHSLWTEMLEKYSDYLVIELVEIWKMNLDNAIDYMTANKKHPSQCDKNRNIHQLACWVNIQKGNYDPDINNCKKSMKTQEIHTMWSEMLVKYSDYLGSRTELWKLELEKVVNYMDANKKCPSNKDKTQEIKKLGTWVGNQKRIYDPDINKCKQIMETKEIYDQWTEILVKYSNCLVIDMNELWKLELNKLVDYMEVNKKSPSQRDKDAEIKKLGLWVCRQKRIYDPDINKCKERMKTQEIHTLWSDLTKHPVYGVYLGYITEPKKKSMKLNTATTQPKPETSTERQTRVKSEISVLHQRYKTLNSVNLHNEFKTNPELWTQYHAISEQNEETFPVVEIPSNVIIATLDKIKSNRTRRVVDMGCGKAQISQHFKDDPRFSFTNYDHIAFDESIVTSCDISKTPIEDDSTDIVILSLAMWGSNCHSYITEAFRILENAGTLYIIEPTKRWSEMDGYNIKPGTAASKLRSVLTDNGFDIVKENIEKFCMFTCRKP